MYIDTKKFKDYGKLSRQNMNELDTGARVEVDSGKGILWTLRYGRLRKRGRDSMGSALGKRQTGVAYRMLCNGNKISWKTIDIHAEARILYSLIMK